MKKLLSSTLISCESTKFGMMTSISSLRGLETDSIRCVKQARKQKIAN